MAVSLTHLTLETHFPLLAACRLFVFARTIACYHFLTTSAVGPYCQLGGPMSLFPFVTSLQQLVLGS